jgi:hypothetical protein
MAILSRVNPFGFDLVHGATLSDPSAGLPLGDTGNVGASRSFMVLDTIGILWHTTPYEGHADFL